MKQVLSYYLFIELGIIPLLIIVGFGIGLYFKKMKQTTFIWLSIIIIIIWLLHLSRWLEAFFIPFTFAGSLSFFMTLSWSTYKETSKIIVGLLITGLMIIAGFTSFMGLVFGLSPSISRDIFRNEAGNIIIRRCEIYSGWHNWSGIETIFTFERGQLIPMREEIEFSSRHGFSICRLPTL